MRDDPATFDPWTQVNQAIQHVVDDRKGEYDQVTVANVQNLIKMLRSTGCPAPQIQAGYHPTFSVTWVAPEAENLELEVGKDRIEVYKFLNGRMTIWHEPVVPGQPYSPAFLAELPASEANSN